MTRLGWLFTAGLIGLATLGAAASPAGAEKPNVVLIVADNLGHGDLSCYGCPDITTPNIDKLAAQGVRFNNFYSNGPECTPTRTALFTGRYQQRLVGLECALGSGNVGRYDDAIRLAERGQLGLPPSESTLIHSLKKAGYRTVGFGKWHLGYEKHFLPPHHGFDYFLASLGGTIDYFYHNEPDGTPVLYENDRPVRRDGYFTDMITGGAVDFLRKHPKGEPFFLYLPYTAPSAPLQHPDRKPARPKVSHAWDSGDWQAGTRDVLRLIIKRLDQGVGKVLATLEETGRADGTLVIFCSDNGAYPIAASNAPFRGHASELFEGGIHVACMARWPGKLPPKTVDDRPVMTFDLSASILAAAGITPPADRPLDGIDVLGQIAAGRPPQQRTLFWRSRRADRTWRAVRDGKLKYVSRTDDDGFSEWLFDLSRDPGEKSDLSDSLPDQLARLKKRLAAWEQEVQPDGNRGARRGAEDRLERVTHRVELADPASPEKPPRIYEVVQTRDRRRFPVEYALSFETHVCDTGQCRPVEVTMAWNAAGGFERLECPPGKPLTKKDHEPFTDEDYAKLDRILKDRGSMLRGWTLDFLEEPAEPAHGGGNSIDDGLADGVDAVTQPTPVAVQEAVVRDAAYTSWALWHWANGAIVPELRRMTEASCTPEYLQHLLLSDDRRLTDFALDYVIEHHPSDGRFAEGVFHVLGHGERDQIGRSLDFLARAVPDKRRLHAGLIEAFSQRCSAEGILILRRLLDEPDLPAATLEDLTGRLDELPYFPIHLILRALEERRFASEKTISDVAALLKSDDFFIARRAYEHLAQQDLDADTQGRVSAFRERSRGRL